MSLFGKLNLKMITRADVFTFLTNRKLISINNCVHIERCFSLTITRRNRTIIDPPDNNIETELPEYQKRENEPLHVRKARLVYQSRKRGMLENDLLLSTFVAKHLNSFTEKQLEEYDKLINKPSNDWDIFNWANGKKPTPPEYDTDVMRLLKEHLKNVHKEVRIRQPDL